MTLLLDLLKNYILAAALCSWLITQVLKFFVAWIAEGHPDIHRLFGDGGMPSGHTATVICMSVMAGYTCGFASPLFGIAFLFAIVVMHDATGVRRETGKQAVVLLDIFSTLGDALFESDSIRRREKLKTMVGHTPMQVFFGAIVGLVVAILFIWIFGIAYKVYA